MLSPRPVEQRVIGWMLLVLVVLGLSPDVALGQLGVPQTAPSQSVPNQTAPGFGYSEHGGMALQDDLGIAPGDVLTLTVFDTPEFTGPIRVANDGTIQLPLVGKVTIAGLTTSAAAELIRNLLIKGDFMKDPQVILSFTDFGNHSAVVLGEVSRPGSVPLTGNRTLYEVIAGAGGAAVTAGDTVTIVHAGAQQATETYTMHWDRPLQGQPNPLVRSGDTVQVSRAGIIYIVGKVAKSGGYPINHEKITVAQAIVWAGGIQSLSKASHARLVRQTPNGRVVTELNLPDIVNGKLPDVPMQDNDLLYVPTSLTKTAIARGLEAAITITSALVIYKNQGTH
ncbi:polysaccharide biosynthesis/export family protein [Terriglobus saanensis]|uniref:Polysaccharide export protein n=1 Tax=Terriglobus saanensis (strain ATCC BAA-1853 / DSM 23119 / SP1PR4) TaxID=401053 RepID=E8UZE0_TERSS|nr:polysaccharide biosynthesis/export family protein [Terriglobus saanensis]ADV83220.1 polysaccharide export protein [Terriglobus saanensis SP1PR4]